MTMKKSKSFKEAPKSFRYTVLGNPLSQSKVDNTEPRLWDDYKQARFNYIQSLKNQHEKKCRQLVDDPIQLEATFYVKPHVEFINTPILSLFNFMCKTIQGVICKKNCAISSVRLKKIYDEKPRTEIKIVRLQ